MAGAHSIVHIQGLGKIATNNHPESYLLRDDAAMNSLRRRRADVAPLPPLATVRRGMDPATAGLVW